MTVTEFNTRFTPLKTTLVGFAIKLTKDQDKANDLIQETSMRAFDKRESFRDGTNFKAWVTTIMRNSFINNYRKLKTRSQVEQPVEDMLYVAHSATVKEKASSSIMMKELNQIVASLSESYRIPFLMYYRGYSYLEIGDRMDLPLGTVKSRIFFARKQLKEMIGAKYGENLMMTA